MYRGLNRKDSAGDVLIETRFQKVDKKLEASFQRIYNDGTDYVKKDIMKRRLTSHEEKARQGAFIAGRQARLGLKLGHYPMATLVDMTLSQGSSPARISRTGRRSLSTNR